MITKFEWLLFTLIFLLMGVLGFLGFRYNVIDKELAQSQLVVSNLQKNLAELNLENADLANYLQNEQAKNNLFQSQIEEITGQVVVLTKLNQTDKELLQKYSKVYFLNENYTPAQLTAISDTYVKDKSQTLKFHENAWLYLQRLLKSANRNKTPLLIVSAYRSFKEQSDLKSVYRVTYGSGTANSFSAEQGYSEHQLGTTVDFATASSTTATFEATAANKWLLDNAHRYGFVLSYPKKNTYYVYEPWHWRFVGVQLATRLYEDDQYFYELTQREIDEYLVSIFD